MIPVPWSCWGSACQARFHTARSCAWIRGTFSPQVLWSQPTPLTELASDTETKKRIGYIVASLTRPPAKWRSKLTSLVLSSPPPSTQHKAVLCPKRANFSQRQDTGSPADETPPWQQTRPALVLHQHSPSIISIKSLRSL